MSLANYEIGNNLGKGAFGSVFIVKRKEDGQTFAMKRIHLTKLSHKEKENALNEIRLLASLSHKNIIGYEEAFFDEESETLNIIIEYADDGDLASKIKNNKIYNTAFNEDQIWTYLVQILQGIHYLHTNKIMHRDIKSANIFLMNDGTIKLGDLNVSKIAKADLALTQAGTPYYTSPEIWQDKPYNYKCDIWSVGCLMYELCTHRPPFRGNNLKQLYDNVMKGIYDSLPSTYSSELETTIKMMLIVDPNLRPDCDQLLNNEIIKSKSKLNNTEQAKITKVELYQTIKLPRNINDINKELPSKKKSMLTKEKEMLKHDNYEINKDIYKPNQIILTKHSLNRDNIRKVVSNPVSINKPNNRLVLDKAKKEILILAEDNKNNNNSCKNVVHNTKFMKRIHEIKNKYLVDQSNSNNNNIDNHFCQSRVTDQVIESSSKLINKDNNIKYDIKASIPFLGLKKEEPQDDKQNNDYYKGNNIDKDDNFHDYFKQYKNLKLNQKNIEEIQHQEPIKDNHNMKPPMNQISSRQYDEVLNKQIVHHNDIKCQHNIKETNESLSNDNHYIEIRNIKEKPNHYRQYGQYDKKNQQDDIFDKLYSKRNHRDNISNPNPKTKPIESNDKSHGSKYHDIDNLFKEIDKESQRRKNSQQINHLKYLLYK